jgi:hypothetical protein
VLLLLLQSNLRVLEHGIAQKRARKRVLALLGVSGGLLAAAGR